MKNIYSRGKGSNNKISFTNNKNIDLRIPKISGGITVDKSVSFNNAPVRIMPAYSVNKTRQMDWKQLKKKFPGLSPTADSDFDGLINSKDCKPFDPSKDGAFSRFIGIVTGGKKGQTKEEYAAEKKSKSLAKQIAARKKIEANVEKRAQKVVNKKGYVGESEMERIKKIESLRKMVKSKPLENVETIIRRITPTTVKEKSAARARQKKSIVRSVERFSGVKKAQTKSTKTAPGQKGSGAGRPKQSYKYRDPRTGQPISAVEYHKLRKQLKNQAKVVETKAEVQQRFELAKRGLSPEEVAQAQEEINARIARLKAMQEAQQVMSSAEVVQQIPSEQVIQQQVQQAPQQSVRYQRVQRVVPVRQQPSSYNIPPGYRLQDDLMTGRKSLVKLPESEAWTR